MQKQIRQKKDAAWECISYMTGKEYRSSYFENLATKGAPNPVIIPRDDMSITDFYESRKNTQKCLNLQNPSDVWNSTEKQTWNLC